MAGATRRGFGTLRVRKKDKGRKRFYAEYTGPDSKRHSAGHAFDTKADAEGWLTAEKALIDRGEWKSPAAREAEKQRAAAEQQRAAVTVGEWLDRYHDNLDQRSQPIKPSTAQNYRRVTRVRITDPIAPGDDDVDVTRLKDIRLCDLETDDVYRWWDALQRNYPDARTINRQAYVRLKAACAEAVRRKMILTNPVDIPEAGKPVTTTEKYLPSDAEIAAIIDAMPERYKALTSLVLRHGLRLGEALAIEARHVVVEPTPVPYLPKVSVRVEQNAQRIAAADGKPTYMLVQPPKTKAGYRTVPIMAIDVPLFLHHSKKYVPKKATLVPVLAPPNADKATRNKVSDKPLVLYTPNGKGQPLMDTTFRSLLNKAETEAGVTTQIDPHCGRNWLITRLAEQGAHLKEIGALLGQEDVQTILNVYMKARPERTTDLMAQVNRSLDR